MSEETRTEEWRPIPGFDGFSASSLGRIRDARFKKEECRPLYPDRAGYRRVNLNQPGATKQGQQVHRLVAMAFLGEPGPGQIQVNHINSDPSDNRAENLEWATRSENMRHAYRFGKACNKGERNSNSKLTDGQVLSVFTRRSMGESAESIAADLGVTKTTVGDILIGKTWRHLQHCSKAVAA